MKEMSTIEKQIAERSKKHRSEPLTNLHPFINVTMPEETFRNLNRQSSAGTDHETRDDDEEQKKERIPQLLSDIRNGCHRASNVRRVYIPKGDGKQRPSGIPTIEDRLLQRTVTGVITPRLMKQRFYGCSCGFGVGRTLSKEVGCKGDALRHRRRPARLLRQHQSPATVRVFRPSDEGWSYTQNATQTVKSRDTGREPGDLLRRRGAAERLCPPPPPLSGNICLHYVPDDRFIKQIQPLTEKEKLSTPLRG